MYKYNDIIEYIDETNDLNFNNAQIWAVANNASLIEQVGKRKNQNGLLYRYFIIRENVNNPLEPTVDELQSIVKNIRNQYLDETDYTQLSDSPLTSDEKKLYKEYRKYLRDYTEKEEWWLENPLTFEDWQKTIDF